MEINWLFYNKYRIQETTLQFEIPEKQDCEIFKEDFQKRRVIEIIRHENDANVIDFCLENKDLFEYKKSNLDFYIIGYERKTFSCLSPSPFIIALLFRKFELAKKIKEIFPTQDYVERTFVPSESGPWILTKNTLQLMAYFGMYDLEFLNIIKDFALLEPHTLMKLDSKNRNVVSILARGIQSNSRNEMILNILDVNPDCLYTTYESRASYFMIISSIFKSNRKLGELIFKKYASHQISNRTISPVLGAL